MSRGDMSENVEALIVDLLLWLEARELTYEQVIDAWRTSCPRLPVWEEANDRGLVVCEQDAERHVVRVSAAGLDILHRVRKRHGARQDISRG